MENILNQLLIPDLANLVMEFAQPDYKSMFDCVMRDINWGCLEEQLVNGYYELDDEEIDKLVPKYWIQEFNSVLVEMVGYGQNIGDGGRWFNQV